MEDGLPALRALVFSDKDLADICAIVLTLLAHGEPLVETVNFNEVDVIVDRPQSLIIFQGVLSVNDETVELTEDQFVELASTIAQPLTGEPLAQWQKRRVRRVWPMPPASGDLPLIGMSGRPRTCGGDRPRARASAQLNDDQRLVVAGLAAWPLLPVRIGCFVCLDSAEEVA